MKTPEQELTINGHKYVLAEEQKVTWETVLKWYNKEEWIPDLSQLNKLAITAKYLNGAWVRSENNWGVKLLFDSKEIVASPFGSDLFGAVLFKDIETALKAVEILGEDVVRDALMFGA